MYVYRDTYIHTYIEQTCDIAAYFHAAAANVGACEPYHLTACANEVLTDRRPTCRQHRFGRTGCREREVVRGDNQHETVSRAFKFPMIHPHFLSAKGSCILFDVFVGCQGEACWFLRTL